MYHSNNFLITYPIPFKLYTLIAHSKKVCRIHILGLYLKVYVTLEGLRKFIFHPYLSYYLSDSIQTFHTNTAQWECVTHVYFKGQYQTCRL